MGGVSSNYGEAIARSLLNVANEHAQKCSVAVTQEQTTEFRNITGSDIDYQCNGTQRAVVTTECLQRADTQNDISNAVAQQAKQLADTVTQQFQLTVSVSSNVSKLISEMATAVTNSYSQDCAVQSSQSQRILADNIVDSRLRITCNYDQYADITTNCVMQNRSVNNIAQQINQELDQSAKATTTNWLAGIIGAVAIALALIAIIVFAIMFMRSVPHNNPSPPSNPSPNNPVYNPVTTPLTNPVATPNLA
jgi:cobalamin biosynthesis Mg chelatase CobN